jgi:PhnB protein
MPCVAANKNEEIIMVKAKPDGYHTLTPHVTVKDAPRAIEYYKKAFGAQELYRMPGPDGKIVHAELRIGDSPIMLSDEFPQMGSVSPATIGNTGSGIHIYVEDCDTVYNKAITEGGKALMPPQDMFWGDRYGKLQDPFGHVWSIGTHKEDLTPEQIQKRGEEAMKQMAAGGRK